MVCGYVSVGSTSQTTSVTKFVLPNAEVTRFIRLTFHAPVRDFLLPSLSFCSLYSFSRRDVRRICGVKPRQETHVPMALSRLTLHGRTLGSFFEQTTEPLATASFPLKMVLELASASLRYPAVCHSRSSSLQ
jgi:hypothetical protein